MASIEHRVTGAGPRWRVVWYENGKRERLTFDNPDSAVRFRKSVEGAGDQWPAGWQRPLKAAPPTKPDVLTFGQWAQTAIDRRTRASERTKADYRRDLGRHFADLLDVPLAELDKGHVAGWLDAKRGKLADKTIRNLHGLGSSVFVDALAQHPPLAEHNPFASTLGDIDTTDAVEMVFLTPTEFDRVYSFVRPEYQPLIRLLFGTGLRFGEATALTVRDVNLLAKRPTLTVSKAWKRTGPAAWAVGKPKTPRSRRTLPLSRELVDLLTPLWVGRRGSELLFAGPHGLRLPHIEVYKRGWAPAVAAANVCDDCRPSRLNKRGTPALMPAACDHDDVLGKQPRIHDLRHSHVAALISEGVRLEVISRRLGHSSITITFDRYGHLDPSMDLVVNEAVDRVLARRA